MIVLDTNVLLRYLLEDDPEQFDAASRLFHAAETVLITDVVLAETLWTLSGRRYRASREVQMEVVEALFEEPAVVFEDAAVVWNALGDFASTPAGFQDALIARKGELVARLAGEEPAIFCTFDRDALRLAGARKPSRG